MIIVAFFELLSAAGPPGPFHKRTFAPDHTLLSSVGAATELLPERTKAGPAL